jgi:hypothetical protein
MPRLRVGLSPVVAALMLALSAVDGYLFASTGSTFQLVIAAVMAFAGVTHLFGPLLVVDGNLVELKNPLGLTIRVLPFTSLEISGRKLLVTNDGVTRKVNGWLANSAHWRQLAAAIAAS